MEHLRFLQALAGSGGGWVIYLLFLCSFVAVMVIAERISVVLKHSRYQSRELPRLDQALKPSNVREAPRMLDPGSILAPIADDILKHAPQGKAVMSERLDIQLALQRRRLEHRVIILGTLGNNAPFIGLLGTVLGVIHAFQNLAASAGQGPEVVMSGLAEALVSTAVGILVALPCVAAYNYIEKRINDILIDADHFGRQMIALLGEK